MMVHIYLYGVLISFLLLLAIKGFWDAIYQDENSDELIDLIILAVVWPAIPLILAVYAVCAIPVAIGRLVGRLYVKFRR